MGDSIFIAKVFVFPRLVKLASTKLNYLIGVGAIILYLDTFFFVIPSTSPGVVRVFCNLTPWLTAIGYSLCYGTILAKMARVYYIFNNPSTKKKVRNVAILLRQALKVIWLLPFSVNQGQVSCTECGIFGGYRSDHHSHIHSSGGHQGKLDCPAGLK